MADKALRVIGALLLLANGAVHLQRYNESYQYIPNINKLFVLDAILAALLAIYVLFVGSTWSLGLAILFQVGTIVALVYSNSQPLFDFEQTDLEGWPTVAIAVELAGAFVLGLDLFASRQRVHERYSRV
jgi:ABC-type branched-subunit amino acid transport system permease subunit